MADMSAAPGGLPAGVTKVHGFASTGYEALTSNFEFIAITTAVDIRTYSAHTFSAPPVKSEIDAATAAQAALDKLIQIVSLRGQPVIMGNVGGSGPFTLMLALEHPAAWACTATGSSVPVQTGPWPDARANEDLVTRIKADGINHGFATDSTLAVTFSPVLT